MLTMRKDGIRVATSCVYVRVCVCVCVRVYVCASL